jgi:hypothetical protein
MYELKNMEAGHGGAHLQSQLFKGRRQEDWGSQGHPKPKIKTFTKPHLNHKIGGVYTCNPNYVGGIGRNIMV